MDFGYYILNTYVPERTGRRRACSNGIGPGGCGGRGGVHHDLG